MRCRVRCRVRLLLAFIAVVAPLSEAAFAPAARAGGRAPFAAVRARAPVASLLDPLAAAQLPASLGLVADAAGSPPAFDLLDVVLVSPVLVGFFAVWAISSASDAGKAGSAQAQAERVAAAAQRAKEREEKKAEALAKKVAEEQEAKDRKIQFFNKKLSSDRKEMEEKAKKQTENLRRDVQREREKLRESERTIRELRAELRKAQSDASYVSPPPKAPPPPMPSPPAAAVSVAAAAATAAVEPPPLSIAASAGGKTRLRPGVSSGDVIVVTGASGRTGKLVVEQLLALYPGAKIRAAGRDLATLGAAFPSPDKRVELVGADLYDKESDTFKGLFEGASAANKKLRKWLLETVNVRYVLHAPGGTFENAGVSTNTIVFTNDGPTVRTEFLACADKTCADVVPVHAVTFAEFEGSGNWSMDVGTYAPRPNYATTDPAIWTSTIPSWMV